MNTDTITTDLEPGDRIKAYYRFPRKGAIEGAAFVGTVVTASDNFMTLDSDTNGLMSLATDSVYRIDYIEEVAQ